jgi:hypothetical protein
MDCQSATVTSAAVCWPYSPIATAKLRGASRAGMRCCMHVQAHARASEVGVLILAPFKSQRRSPSPFSLCVFLVPAMAAAELGALLVAPSLACVLYLNQLLLCVIAHGPWAISVMG